MKELELTIDGMHCGACVRRVTGALEKVPGVHVEAVRVGAARVGYDPAQVEPVGIRAAVEKIGFTVTNQQ